MNRKTLHHSIKRLMILVLMVWTANYSFAGDDQSLKIKRLLNRKIIFPEQLEIAEKTTVQIQLEIMPDGCLALTKSNGNPEIIGYIANRIENCKLSYNQNGNNFFVYQFTFEKELSHNQRK